VYDHLVASPSLEAITLGGFFLLVAALSEYVFANGYAFHRLVALAGGLPLVPLLPLHVGWLAAHAPVLTWAVASAVGFVAVNLCQRAVVVQVDRALDEWRYRRSLRAVPAAVGVARPAAAPSKAAPQVGLADPHYFWSRDGADALFGSTPEVNGDPLAKAPSPRRDVA
jgi:hypothetical protein